MFQSFLNTKDQIHNTSYPSKILKKESEVNERFIGTNNLSSSMDSFNDSQNSDNESPINGNEKKITSSSQGNKDS